MTDEPNNNPSRCTVRGCKLKGITSFLTCAKEGLYYAKSQGKLSSVVKFEIMRRLESYQN
jgi:hypothetical protein